MLYETNADIAMTNGGGIRSGIDAGDITKGEIITTLPFGNYIVTKKLTGAQIKQVLEHGVQSYPETLGAFAQVAGLEFVFDKSKKTGERITSITIDGKEIDKNAEYIVATNDFIAIGGDDYPCFKGLAVQNEFKGLDEALESYISYLGEVDYKVEGRIQVKQEGSGSGNNGGSSSGDSTKPSETQRPSEAQRPSETPKPNKEDSDKKPGENKLPSITIENIFKDINLESWFAADVAFVYYNKIMNGISKDSFAPTALATRAMIAQILYNIEGNPNAKGDNIFTDVETGKWYENAVVWCAESGIYKGFGDGSFQPNQEITREQLATILYNYAVYKKYDVSITSSYDKFKDNDKVAKWAQTSMKWAISNKIIGGKSGNVLDPKGKATRAEIAAMINRFIKLDNKN